MPIEIIRTEDALESVRDKNSKWPTHSKDSRYFPFVTPSMSPSFKVEKNDKIFCMGSCFARNIEAALVRLELKCVTKEANNPYSTGDWGGNNFLIRYNPYAMLNELKWALDEKSVFPKSGFLEIEKDLWMDPFQNTYNELRSFEQTEHLRSLAEENTRRIKDCRIFILTLGLVEAWYDHKTALYTNIRPHKKVLRANPDRFSLHVLSYQDCLNALNEIYDLMKRKGHPDLKILISTSPVPLSCTFRECDVFTANTYSKSVLRSATEEFALKYENIDYFPSYESITLGEKKKVWDPDQRHVNQETVRYNVTRMIQQYASSSISNYSKVMEPFKLRRPWVIRYKKASKALRAPFKKVLKGMGLKSKFLGLAR